MLVGSKVRNKKIEILTLKFLFSAQFTSQAFFKLVKETKRNKGGATLSISNEKNILMGSFNDAHLKVDTLAKVCIKFHILLFLSVTRKNIM